MDVTVDVRCNGRLAEALGSRRRVRLPAGATVAELLGVLAADAGLETATGLAVSVAGQVVGADRRLDDGDAVAVLTPIAGG
ncbi:MAG: MoaD/ThiS family protein [Thermoleophilia bacterium]